MRSYAAASGSWLSIFGINKHLGAISALIFSLILSACGGGGGGGGNPGPAQTGAPALTEVSMSSGELTTVTVGDKVSVMITANEAIQAPSVVIGGTAADRVVGSGTSWTADRVLTSEDSAGAITLSISFSDIGGEAGTTVTDTTDGSALTMEINSEAGNVVDGPFQNARVFADYNGNGVLDEGEPSQLTDADGGYSLTKTSDAPDSFMVVVQMTADTIDSISGESYADTGVVLKAASGGAMVTPVTTLLESIKATDPTYTAADLATDMGLPAGIDVTTYNPFAEDAVAADAHAVEKVFQQVMTATLVVAEAMAGLGDLAGTALSAEQATAAALNAVASMVLASDVTVDLSDSTQLDAVQAAAKTELAEVGVVVDTATADFFLSKAADTAQQIATEIKNVSLDDFGKAAASSVSKLKHNAKEQLAAMSAAAVTFLADAANSDLTAFNTSTILTLDTADGVASVVAENREAVNAFLGLVPLTIFDNGVVSDAFGGNATLHFFDEANDYGDCTDEAAGFGVETCGSVDWTLVEDADRGNVLQVTYAADAQHAGLVLAKQEADATPVNLSTYATGSFTFDIKVISMGSATGFKLKLESGNANSGELAVSDITGSGAWETVNFPMTDLIAGGLLASSVNVPMVFFPDEDTGMNLQYQLDNVRFIPGEAAEDIAQVEVGPQDVTFSVDMTGVDLGGNVVTLNGTFNGWCGACNPMSDDDGDNIWTLTIPLDPGSYDYKYALGAWVGQETVPAECATTGDYQNRTFVLAGTAALTTDPVEYGGCPEGVVVAPPTTNPDTSEDNGTSSATAPTTVPANPPLIPSSVISLYGDSFTQDVTVTWANQYSGADVVATDNYSTGAGEVIEFAGMSYAIMQFASQVDASAMTHLHMDVWVADTEEFLIKIVDTGPGWPNNTEGPTTLNAASTPELVAGSWVSVDISLDDLIANTAFASKAAIGEIVIEAVGASGKNIYIDNIYFYDSAAEPETAPSAIAADPTVASDSVISLYGDSYTQDVTVTWANQYSGADVVATDNYSTGAGEVIEFAGMSYAIMQFASQVDASAMTHLHMDVWVADTEEFLIKIVDTGPGWPNNTEGPTTLNAASTPELVAGSWVSVDISLDDLIANTAFASKAAIGEIVIEAVGASGKNIYIDNIYFYDSAAESAEPAEPETAPSAIAADPIVAPDSVISLYGDSYTQDVTVTWANQYSGADVVATDNYSTGAGEVIEFAGMSYAIMQFASQVDASAMTHLHMDVWVADTEEFLIKIVDTGPGWPNNTEGPTTLNAASTPELVAGSWVSVDISLDDLIANTAFASKAAIGEIVIEAVGASGKNIYIDNIYFYDSAALLP